MPSKLLRIAQWLRAPSLTALARDEKTVATARMLVSYFYYFAPFVAFYFSASPFHTRKNFDPIWPLEWVHTFGLEYLTVVDVIAIVFIGTTMIGAIFHRYWWARALVFVGFWQAHALESSFGSPNHQWYMWMYVSLIFVLLPNVWHRHDHESNRRFLLYVWAGQALVALMYTMAGVTKVLEAIHQSLRGEVHAFSVDAFAYQIAYFVPRLQERAALADLIVHYPVVGWPPYVALVFIQLFTFWIMIRPSLQPVWLPPIMLFHFLTYFTMGISFHPQIILVILLFCNSPFAKPYTSFMAFVRDVPIIGQILERIPSRSHST